MTGALQIFALMCCVTASSADKHPTFDLADNSTDHNELIQAAVTLSDVADKVQSGFAIEGLLAFKFLVYFMKVLAGYAHNGAVMVKGGKVVKMYAHPISIKKILIEQGICLYMGEYLAPQVVEQLKGAIEGHDLIKAERVKATMADYEKAGMRTFGRGGTRQFNSDQKMEGADAIIREDWEPKSYTEQILGKKTFGGYLASKIDEKFGTSLEDKPPVVEGPLRLGRSGTMVASGQVPFMQYMNMDSNLGDDDDEAREMRENGWWRAIGLYLYNGRETFDWAMTKLDWRIQGLSFVDLVAQLGNVGANDLLRTKVALMTSLPQWVADTNAITNDGGAFGVLMGIVSGLQDWAHTGNMPAALAGSAFVTTISAAMKAYIGWLCSGAHSTL